MVKAGKKKSEAMGNTTYKRLEGLPFKNATELNKAEDKIRHAVWSRLTEATVFDELIEKDQFKKVKQELQAGLSYNYGSDGEAILKVYSEGQGIKVKIDQSFAESVGKNENKMFESMLRAASDSFGELYYRAKGLLRRDKDPDENSIQSK